MSLKPGKDQQTYVQDMLESARQAADYVRGLSFDQFWDDHKTRDAVAMRLQVVGEAATLQQTVDAYQAQKPDLVTLDLSLADTDGVTVLNSLLSAICRRDGARLPRVRR